MVKARLFDKLSKELPSNHGDDQKFQVFEVEINIDELTRFGWSINDDNEHVCPGCK